MTTEHVIVTDADGIRTIRMNRPDKKNALTLAMYKAMTAAFEGSKADGSVRCVLIAGVPVHQINARGTFMVSKYAIAHLERAQNERSASTNFRTGRVIPTFIEGDSVAPDSLAPGSVIRCLVSGNNS